MTSMTKCRRVRRRCVGAILAGAVVIVGILVSTTSAQPTRVRCKGEQAQVVARNEILLGDGTTGRLESLYRVLRSDASEWDNAQVFSVRFSDPSMRQNQVMRGQMIVIHANGERTFLDYELRWKPGGVTTEFELVGRFLQGTGKFKGITGRWIERGVSTMTEDTSECQIEYSLP